MGLDKKVCVITNGCPENRIDGARVELFLKENDYQLTNDFLEADIIVFNACKVKRSLEIIKYLKKIKKEAELIVYGCLTKTRTDELSQIYQGVTFGSDEVEYFNRIFEAKKIQAQDVHANYLLPKMPNLLKKPLIYKYAHLGIGEIIPNLRRTIAKRIVDKEYRLLQKKVNATHSGTFPIKVSNGCTCACTFCAIRFARGKLKSKPVDKVLGRIQKWFESGFQRVRTHRD